MCVSVQRRHPSNEKSLQSSVPAAIMNVFDRNINFDALFKFSQMYVMTLLCDVCQCCFNSSFHLSRSARCNLSLQISLHSGALEECVLQPGSVYVCGCSWILRPCRHTPLSGNNIQQILDAGTHHIYGYTILYV